MLINCPECSREVSDKAQTCPSCGYALAVPQPPPIPAKVAKTAVFQFMALAGAGVALLTPLILLSIVCLFIIATGVVSLFRGEPRRWLSVLGILLGIFFLLTASSSLSNILNGDKDYISKIGNTWDQKTSVSLLTIHGRVTNNGDKVVESVSLTASYRDAAGNVLDTDPGYVLGEMAPGDSKEYNIFHSNTSSEYSSIDVVVTEVRTK